MLHLFLETKHSSRYLSWINDTSLCCGGISFPKRIIIFKISLVFLTIVIVLPMLLSSPISNAYAYGLILPTKDTCLKYGDSSCNSYCLKEYGAPCAQVTPQSKPLSQGSKMSPPSDADHTDTIKVGPTTTGGSATGGSATGGNGLGVGGACYNCNNYYYGGSATGGAADSDE